MTTRRKLMIGLGVLLGVPLLLVTILLAYLSFADLGRHRETIANWLGDALGREVMIAGLDADIGFTSHIQVRGVTLGNPPGIPGPAMLQVGLASITIDLPSLISGRILVHEVLVRDARIDLQIGMDGHANWEFGEDTAAEAAGTGPPPGIVIENGRLENVEVTFRDRTKEGDPQEFAVASLQMHTDERERIEFALSSRCNDIPVQLSGLIGPMMALLEGMNLEQDVSGSIGAARLSVNGVIGDLSTLAGLDLRFEFSGEEISAVSEMLTLNSPATGPFHLSGRMSPAAEEFDLEVEARMAGAETKVMGRLDSLLEPSRLDISIASSGSDLAIAGSAIGIEALPAAPFAFSGGVRWEGFPIALRQIEIKVGENRLSVDGELGEPPLLLQTDLELHAAGPDLSLLGSLVRVDAPPAAFEIDGRLRRLADGIGVDELSMRVGETTATVKGIVGDPPQFTGTEITLRAAGPDLSIFSGLAGAKLPEDRFTIEGGFKHKGPGIALDSVQARLGQNRINLSGSVSLAAAYVGTDVRLAADVPDLAALGALAGRALPPVPLSIAGGVRVLQNGYNLSAVELRVGDVVVELHGHAGRLPELNGTALDVDVRGPRVSTVGVLLDRPGLPDAPFSVVGSFGLHDGGYHLNGVRVELEGNRIDLQGVVQPTDGWTGTEIALELTGPDLQQLGYLVEEAGVAGLSGLPPAPFRIAGRAGIEDSGYALDGIEILLGEIEGRLHGRIGMPRLVGSDLSLDINGPDLAALSSLAGRDLPPLPFRVAGRVERLQSGGRVHELFATLGEARIELNGLIGEPRAFIGTRLDLAASGPSLASVGQVVGRGGLPDRPFEIAGHFDGTAERFALRDFAARVGRSDLQGSLRIDREAKPEVEGRFSSARLDLDELSGGRGTVSDTAGQASEEPPQKEGDSMLLSDRPLELEILQSADVDVTWNVAALDMPHLHWSGVQLGLRLRDGHLEIDPLAGIASNGGSISAGLVLGPGGDAGLRLAVDDLRWDLTEAEDDPGEWPLIDIQADLVGRGGSAHQIAADLSGHVAAVVRGGRIDNSLIDVLVADFLVTLFKVMNPFAKEDKFTDLECLVLAAGFDDGTVRIDPLVMRSNKMVMIGDGGIELADETLDVEWATKPRKGIGLSASAFTNPFVKLGGTLSDPKLNIKGLDAMAKGSLSLLSLGIWDRLSAERKVCKKAVRKAAELAGQGGSSLVD